MEYKLLILEKLDDDYISSHAFPLDKYSLDDALKFRTLHFHIDCVFVLEYCIN